MCSQVLKHSAHGGPREVRSRGESSKRVKTGREREKNREAENKARKKAEERALKQQKGRKEEKELQ